MYKIIIQINILLLFLTLITGCEIGLSSDNYWKGLDEENKYVNEHFISNSKSENSTEDSEFIIPPFTKTDKTKFRIGVVVSGDYWEFFENFKGFIGGMSDITWGQQLSVPSSYSHTEEIISWLNNKNFSDYVDFPSEYFVNLQWGDNMTELEEKYFSDTSVPLDLILVYGGMAAKAFYQQETYPVPVMSDAITDCFEAGVTLSMTDSGKDFFTNKIDPNINKQQLRLFSDIVQFKKLGIIYGNDEYGLLYGAVKDVETIAEEKGFEIVRNTNVKESIENDTVNLYLAALKDIVTKVDAVYLGATTAITEFNIMPQVVEILNDAKVPSFALEGTIRVKDGVLFSLSSYSGMKRSGIWMATKMSHILSGESPRKLNQTFDNIASIAINLETAQKIGYKVPLTLAVNSDEIYLDTKGSLAGADNEDKATVVQQLLPCRNKNGKKYQIAVVQSGSYWEFNEHFKGIISGLKTNGWINSNIDLSKLNSIDDIYSLFESKEYSNYIEFPEKYLVNLDWGNRTETLDSLFENKNADVDLIIGFGGVAGKTIIKKGDGKTPVILEAITDPIGSGIVYSVTDSGRNNITCRVDQTQYQRQIKLFHDITRFKKLGIVYGNDEYGRIYSAVNDVELMSLKLGFKIVKNTNVKEEVSPNTVALYLDALRDVCRRSDAVFIGASTAVTEYNIMPQIRKILEEEKIPSFSLEGSIRVKDGILLGVSSVESEKIGLYNANKIASILYGEIPRLLSQEFVGVPMIAINLDMATNINFDIPLATLVTIDQLYVDEKK